MCLLEMVGKEGNRGERRKIHSKVDTSMCIEALDGMMDVGLMAVEGKKKDCEEDCKSRDACKLAYLSLASLVMQKFVVEKPAAKELFVPFLTVGGSFVELFVMASQEEEYAL